MTAQNLQFVLDGIISKCVKYGLRNNAKAVCINSILPFNSGHSKFFSWLFPSNFGEFIWIKFRKFFRIHPTCPQWCSTFFEFFWRESPSINFVGLKNFSFQFRQRDFVSYTVVPVLHLNHQTIADPFFKFLVCDVSHRLVPCGSGFWWHQFSSFLIKFLFGIWILIKSYYRPIFIKNSSIFFTGVHAIVVIWFWIVRVKVLCCTRFQDTNFGTRGSHNLRKILVNGNDNGCHVPCDICNLPTNGRRSIGYYGFCMYAPWCIDRIMAAISIAPSPWLVRNWNGLFIIIQFWNVFFGNLIRLFYF
mmetsp:Transcript_8045/g.11496  ORF Transcript_8045/g.11496 Transcript_8045/m.11496 type:complete len:303 (-) Transcript_8045:928-1836(-)